MEYHRRPPKQHSYSLVSRLSMPAFMDVSGVCRRSFKFHKLLDTWTMQMRWWYAHIHAGLLKDEGLANGIGNLGSAVDEAVGKLLHAVSGNTPMSWICQAQ